MSLITDNYYYSLKIFPQFWLAKSKRINHHNQLLMTKFERILCLTRKWRQKCGPLQVKAPLPRRPGDEFQLFWLWKKKWRTIYSFQEEELQLKLGEIINKNMAKTAASVDNTLRDLLNSSYPTQSHSLTAKYYPSVYFLLLNTLSYTLFHERLLHFLPAECATVIISTDLLCDIVCYDSLVSTKLLWLESYYSIFCKNDWINALHFS